MSNIRRQSIISSILIYTGFAFGALNTYLFTKEGGFTKEQYGLTGAFMAIGSIMMSVASLGMPSYINKFFPYYKDRLPQKQNDQATWALLVATLGFVLVMLAGLFMKGVVNKAFDNSPQLVEYYYWIFPFGFGLTIFTVLEALAWQNHKSILSNYLREVQFRLFVTILFILSGIGLIGNFDLFIKIYAFLYIFLAAILLIYLISTGRLHFTFSVSKVTRRFFKKIITLCSFVWGGSLIYNLAMVADTVIIMAVMPDGVAMAGLFTFAQYLTSIIQAPQRSIIAASVAHLSQAWKDKDYGKINRIYYRSSINQLIFSVAMLCLIWLNYKDAIVSFNLQQDYLYAFSVFIIMGFVKVVDMGTGVSGQIIATSTFWRFDFLTGIVLLALTLPLTWFFTKSYGLIGPALSNLIAFTVYNFIRYLFLLRKFRMQPFGVKSFYTLLLAAGCFIICFFIMKDQQGLVWLVIRSLVFLALFTAGVFYLKLTPDLEPVLATIKKRMGIKK